MAGSVKHCERCGTEFSRPAKLSADQWGRRMFCSRRCAGLRRQLSDREIIAMYESGLSTTEIGRKVSLSGVQIARIVKSVASVRGPSERLRLSHARPAVKEKISKAHTGRPCPDHVKDALRQRIGPKNHNWRGGITTLTSGYLAFTNSPENGAHRGRTVHAVIAEWKIGRPLKCDEVVHHLDRNKMNNDPANLMVMTHSEHARHHALENNLGIKKCQAV